MFRLLIFITLYLVVVSSATTTQTPQPQPQRENGFFEIDQPFYTYRVEDVGPEIRPLNELDYLLPKTTRPIEYDLWIKTDIDQGIFEYEGKVAIQIEVLEMTSSITLHTFGLQFKSFKLVAVEDGVEIALKEHTLEEEFDFLVITTEDTILVQDELYILTIEFENTLRSETSLNGFYRSRYRNGQNQERWLASTKFEPTWARYAFPCYDEPTLKAVFKLTIQHGCSYHALSNMPESVTRTVENTCETEFEKSVLMSSYLVEFIISDFDFVENYDGPIQPNRVKHRVFHPKDNYVDSVDLPLNTGELLLNAQVEYFGVPYTLPKLDQIGIPGYGGAMENWGMVTYGPSSLYVNLEMRPLTTILRPLETVSHEFVHQWFGDLVTPENWGFLWLNEGFARYFGYHFMDSVFTDYRYRDNRMVDSCANVKNTDARASTKPMTRYVYDKPNIQLMFDNIAYDKAGCVINMMRHVLTDDKFTLGLKNYLEERQFKNSNPDYLSAALNDVAHQSPESIPSDINFKTIFDTWHTQAGLPLLTVKFNRETGALTLSQQRYTIEPVENAENALWWIPYNFVSTSEAGKPEFAYTTPDGWFTERETIVSVTQERDWSAEDWILFNKHQTGYYRVNYDDDNWKALSEGLKSDDAGNIPVMSRVQLIDDAFELAANKIVKYQIPFDLLMYLPVFGELDPYAWVTLNTRLTPINTNFVGSSVHFKFKNYVRQLTTPLFEKFSFYETSDEPVYTHYTRLHLIEWACRSGVEACLVESATAIKNHYDGSTILPAYLYDRILPHGMRRMDRESFLKIWKIITTDTAGQAAKYTALSHVENEELLGLYLTSAITATGEELEDITINYTSANRNTIITSIIANQPNGAAYVMDFLTEASRYEIVVDLLNITPILTQLSQHVKTEENKEKFINLLAMYEDNHTGSSEDLLKRIDDSLDWLKEFGAEMDTWLEDNDFGGAQTILVSSVLMVVAVITTICQIY